MSVATWKCPNCGEVSALGYDKCWKCGVSRPEDAAIPNQPPTMTEETETRQTREAEKPRNAFALTGLILGIASVFLSFIGIIPILAIIFSGIGLAKVRDRAGKGKVQAWIGLILGILYTLVYMYQYGHLG